MRLTPHIREFGAVVRDERDFSRRVSVIMIASVPVDAPSLDDAPSSDRRFDDLFERRFRRRGVASPNPGPFDRDEVVFGGPRCEGL